MTAMGSLRLGIPRMTFGTKDHLPQISFDASKLEPELAIERWTTVTTSYAVTLPQVTKSTPFVLEACAYVLDDVILGTGKFGTTVRAARTKSQLRVDHLDHYKVALFVDGVYESDLGGGLRRHLDRPGEFMVTDMAKQETTVSTGSLLELYIPRDRLDERLSRPMHLHGVKPAGPLASLFSSHFIELARSAPMLNTNCGGFVADATIALLAGSLMEQSEQPSIAQPAFEATLLRQLCRYIDLHLDETTLGVEPLCRAFGISRSKLYRLFEPMGGVASFILERRLDRIHHQLVSGDRRPKLSDLAEKYGFASGSHFSRAYRARYGTKPSSVGKGDARDMICHASLSSSDDLKGLQQWLGALRSFKG